MHPIDDSVGTYIFRRTPTRTRLSTPPHSTGAGFTMVALTFVTTHTKWSGQLNPWKNLEFLQKGGQFYNPQNKHEIQEVLARNQRQKKKLGLDAASIDATAANQAKPIAI